MSDIPQWAKERACELANGELSPANPIPWELRHVDGHAALRALARHIAAHEQPPIDPLLVEAREICARVAEIHGSGMAGLYYREGQKDGSPQMQRTLEALQRARDGK